MDLVDSSVDISGVTIDFDYVTVKPEHLSKLIPPTFVPSEEQIKQAASTKGRARRSTVGLVYADPHYHGLGAQSRVRAVRRSIPPRWRSI